MAAVNSAYFDKGLNTAEIQANLRKYGYNELVTKKEFTALKIFLSQFSSFLIIILVIAGSLSIFLKETVDGIAIFAIVIINAIIGFIQEYKAENAVKALKKMIVPVTVVIRNGLKKQIPIRELVPEDIVLLSEGDKVPADIEIIENFSLTVDEAVLTGESFPVHKNIGKGKDGMLFKGTLITSGRSKGRVLATGMNTEFGKIVHLLAQEEKTRSPLAIQLDELSKKIGVIVLFLVAILFILGYFRGMDLLEMLMISVALGVSAIPEGMPIIVTLTLAMGVQVLARKKAIVRKMNAIETLGATTIICSDKTGTLTLNEMTVKVVNTNFKEVEVPGVGYSWDEKINLSSAEEKKLLEICENCNNSSVENENLLGDPTEIALKILTRKARFVKEYKELDENTFTSERKMMSSLHVANNKKEIMAKGAFEEILKKSKFIQINGKVRKLTTTDRKKILKTAEAYSEKALRVLGFAYKPYKKTFDEKDLIFVGLVGMIDPPRKTVKDSIRAAQDAGIKIRIITGDNAITAKAISQQIGLNVDNIATGDDIDRLNDEELKKVLYDTTIFARTKPQHKYRLVDILKRNNEVVAVTGDGVNDAPALKHADVGIAMGIKGTEATKEVADIVLKDDNFTTIIRTIEEGRRIYNNILDFIKYMLSANFGSIFVVGIITTSGFPLPILPLQILWINIATDALPALALGQSPANPGIMKEKPHSKSENIFRKFYGFIFTALFFQIVIGLALYFYGLSEDKLAGIDSWNFDLPSHARTIIFTQMVVFEIFFAFVCKEEKRVTLKSLFYNKMLVFAVLISLILQLIVVYAPFMQSIFKTVPLTLQEWLYVTLAGLTCFLVPGTHQLIKRIFSKSRN